MPPNIRDKRGISSAQRWRDPEYWPFGLTGEEVTIMLPVDLAYETWDTAEPGMGTFAYETWDDTTPSVQDLAYETWGGVVIPNLFVATPVVPDGFVITRLPDITSGGGSGLPADVAPTSWNLSSTHWNNPITVTTESTIGGYYIVGGVHVPAALTFHRWTDGDTANPKTVNLTDTSITTLTAEYS